MRILFVAPCPHVSGPLGGFIRRVAEVDDLLGSDYYHKDYLVLAGRKQLSGFRVRCGPATAYHFNWWLHRRAVRRLARKYHRVYVHSVYEAQKVLYLYTDASVRVYTDMHGVVPEEELMFGHKDKMAGLNRVESVVIEQSEKIVVSSTAMREHFEHKYGRRLDNSIVVPYLYRDDRAQCILRSSELREDLGLSDTDVVVIFSGTLVRYNRIDHMLKVIQVALSCKRLVFVLLTDQPDELSKRVREMGIHNERVIVRSVPASDVGCYYALARAGFVLREDNVVNKVSCPAKMVEYLAYGLYPIVESPYIGDFCQQGYEYIAMSSMLDDLEGFVLRVSEHSAVNRAIYEQHYRAELYAGTSRYAGWMT